MRFKTLTYLLIISILLISCSASTHLGITYINKPEMKESNEVIWFTYWQDQFDAYAGNVVQPVAGKYPDVSVEAYQRAKVDWDRKVAKAVAKTRIVYTCSASSLVLLLGTITVLVITDGL